MVRKEIIVEEGTASYFATYAWTLLTLTLI